MAELHRTARPKDGAVDERRRYWPAVFAEARQLSKDYLAWRIPMLTFGVAFLFIAVAQGGKEAAEYVAAGLGGAGAVAVVAGGAFIINVVRATERLYWRELEQVNTLAGQRADLEKRWTAENLGIKIQLGGIECYYDEPALDGVMVAVIVHRIINGNSGNATLQITLKAPIAPLVIGTLPHHLPVPYVDYNVPLLPPLINVPAKHGIGPGYLLFQFSRAQITGRPFLRPQTNPTNDELGKRVWDSEMFFEVHDLLNASGEPLEIIPAPGTAHKRYKRMVAEAERQKSKAEEQVHAETEEKEPGV